RLDRLGTLLEGAEALDDRREGGAAECAELVGLGHRRGEHAGQVRSVGETKGHAGQVRTRGRAGRRYINGMRKLWCHALRGVLELEPVAEDELITLRAVLAKILLEVGRRGRLDVADLGAEAVANPEQTVIRSAIPRLVGHRPGREQRDLKFAASGLASAPAVRRGARTIDASLWLRTGSEQSSAHCDGQPAAIIGLMIHR